jgi:hypothetical protein
MVFTKLLSIVGIGRASESDTLIAGIAEAKRRLLAEMGRVRQQRILTTIESEKREREAKELRESGEEKRFEKSVERWGMAELHVDRLDETIDFLQRNVDLIEDAALGLRIGEVTSLAGSLLGNLKLVNPDLERRMTEFEVAYVQLTGRVQNLVGDMQLPPQRENSDIADKAEELKKRLEQG